MRGGVGGGTCLHIQYRVELGQAIHCEVGLLANPPVRKGKGVETAQRLPYCEHQSQTRL